MKMVFRWFPFGEDSVTLAEIRQIPGMTGVVSCIPQIPVGEVWEEDIIKKLNSEIAAYGLENEVIESVNIHEDIKKGLPTRDRYIENYIKTIRNLGKNGVRCLCYNFMPVMDWARSELARPQKDGSFAMSYRHEKALEMNPAILAEKMLSDGFYMPGWEPDRIAAMAADIEFYHNMTQDEYWKNMKYFLDAVIPEAEASDVKMAIHPDDPPWELYGLPKVITNAENIRKFLSLNESPYNGLTFCTGSLGSNVHNDLPAMIREFAPRIHFAHVRNVFHFAEQDFDESAHLSACGDQDMYEIMLALIESGFEGYIRPDHGRMIWGEQARAGYGLYDRALGSQYLLGLEEAIKKSRGIK
ncbi:MAG: mannonate dehydratase [Christensenellaceae bacterium]|nr:mannonate dehydratase [Christensenellaceae bacterium]